jgi:tripartite ATP-independent transporter DctP family solute receptor
MFKRLLFPAATALCAATLLLSTGISVAADYEMRFGLESPASSDRGKSMAFFEEELEKRTDGRIDVQVYYSAVLGTQREMMDQMLTGALQGVRGGFFMDANPKFAIFLMPFLVDGWDQALRLIQSDFTKEVAAGAAERGVHIPAVAISNGFRAWSNNVRPIETAADFEGLRIRVPQLPLFVATMSAFGANPIEMAYSEVYQALQTGVLDGQDNAPANIWDFKIHEVQKYMTISNYATGPDPFMVNLDWYNTLPDDLKVIFDEVAAEATALTDQLQRDREAQIIVDLTKVMEANGGGTNYVSAEALEEFRSRVSGVYDMFIEQGAFTWDDVEEVRRIAPGG